MPIIVRIIIYTIVFAVLAFTTALADSEFHRPFLELIKQDVSDRFAQKCEISIEDVTNRLIGNNGRLVERWSVTACDLSLVYDVEYYPPRHFPDRKYDKVVRLVIG